MSIFIPILSSKRLSGNKYQDNHHNLAKQSSLKLISPCSQLDSPSLYLGVRVMDVERQTNPVVSVKVRSKVLGPGEGGSSRSR